MNFNSKLNPISAVRRCVTLLALAATLVLAGCQSENPMDYLPKASGGYMGMNQVKIRESAGLKRLDAEMSRMQPGASDLDSEKGEKLIMAFDAPANAGTAPPFYGVATGKPGFVDEIVSKYKAAGAQEGKTAGHTTYTSGSVSIAPVGNAGILIFQNPSTLERMVSVSKKKEEGARTSAVFTFVDSEIPDHAFVVAGAAQPLVELGGPLLVTFETMNPQAAAALRKVSMISTTFDWDAHPVVVAKLHVAGKDNADALATAFNQYLALAKGLPMLAAQPELLKVLAPVQAKSAEDGVSVQVDVPAEIAEELFNRMPAAGAGAAPSE